MVNLLETSENTTAELRKEIELLARFKESAYVIQMMAHDTRISTVAETGEDVNDMYILMERGECDLSSILNRLEKDERLTPTKLRYYWEQMLEAVKAIQMERIVHADLKPNNFVLVRGHLKV